MKIGISLNPYGDTYGRYGNDKFSVIRKHGYNAVDYDIADTTTELYSLNDRALIQRVNAEKNLPRTICVVETGEVNSSCSVFVFFSSLKDLIVRIGKNIIRTRI